MHPAWWSTMLGKLLTYLHSSQNSSERATEVYPPFSGLPSLWKNPKLCRVTKCQHSPKQFQNVVINSTVEKRENMYAQIAAFTVL